MTMSSMKAACGAAGAARMIWGNQAGVLVGDFLLRQAFRMMMVDVGSLDALDGCPRPPRSLPRAVMSGCCGKI